jgi:hypothetical protein
MTQLLYLIFAANSDYSLYLLLSLLSLTIIIVMMKAKCGHVEEKLYADAHHGLCRKCHSNFAFLLELEQKYGEDALIEYWYAKILTYSSSERKGEEVDCFIDHLIEFYQQNLIKFPSKELSQKYRKTIQTKEHVRYYMYSRRKSYSLSRC